MADSFSALADKNACKIYGAPYNYGVNHVWFDTPGNSIPWARLQVRAKVGSSCKDVTDGYPVYETSSNNLLVRITGTTTATSGGFTLSSYSGGGSVAIVPITSISFSGGGTTTIGTAPTTGSLVSLAGSSVPSLGYTWNQSGTFKGGTGSGATYVIYDFGSGYLGIGKTSNGSGYSVGDVLTTDPLPNGAVASLTVTAITPDVIPVSYSWGNLSQSATSGAGSGALFAVIRRGTQGVNNAVVTEVLLQNGGAGYVVGDTITIPAASIGGGSNLTLTVTAIDTNPEYSKTYSNLTTTGGTGSGAILSVTRTSIAGRTAPVTNVTIVSPGSGYTVSDSLTISGASIGSATDLTLVCGTPLTVPAGGIASFATGIGSQLGGTIAAEASKTYSNVASYPCIVGVSSGIATTQGAGATFTIERNGTGAVSSITLNNVGSGYSQYDYVVIPAASIGGASLKTEYESVTANYHLFEDGPLELPFVYNTNPKVTPPSVGSTGTYHAGREVYYSLFAECATGDLTSTTLYWCKLADSPVISVENTGMLEWLKNNLPNFYFDLDAASNDLEDFLSIFAFYLELLKTKATALFEGTDTHATPEVILKQWMSQLGADKITHVTTRSMRKYMEYASYLAATRGSYNGMFNAVSKYVDNEALNLVIYGRTNKMRDALNSSFEALEYVDGSYKLNWSPNYATVNTSTSDVGIAVDYTNPTIPSLVPVDVANIHLSRCVGKLYNPTATTKTCTWSLGPRKAYITAGTTIGATSISNIVGAAPNVGDYISCTLPGLPDDTQIHTYAGGVATFTGAVTAVLPTGTELLFSDKSGLRGALSEYIQVEPGAPYSFSGYYERWTTAYNITFGINWRDAAGNLTGTAVTTTVAAGSQPAAGTWARVEVLGTAPASAEYAEPYIQIASLPTSVVYYIDELQFEGNTPVYSASRTTSTVTLQFDYFSNAVSTTVGDKITVVGLGTGYDVTNATITSKAVQSSGIPRLTLQYALSGTAGTSTSTNGRAAFTGQYRDPQWVEVMVANTGFPSDINTGRDDYQTKIGLMISDQVHAGRGKHEVTPRRKSYVLGSGFSISPTLYTEPSIDFASPELYSTIEFTATNVVRITSSSTHKYAVGDKIKATGFTTTAVNTTNDYVTISAVPDAYTFEFPPGSSVSITAATALTAGVVKFFDINKSHTVTVTTPSAHRLKVGNYVRVIGYETNTAVNGGPYPVIAVESPTKFVYALSGSGIAQTAPTVPSAGEAYVIQYLGDSGQIEVRPLAS